MHFITLREISRLYGMVIMKIKIVVETFTKRLVSHIKKKFAFVYVQIISVSIYFIFPVLEKSCNIFSLQNSFKFTLISVLKC